MNYSLNLTHSLDQFKSHANPDTLAVIEELLSVLNSIKPNSQYYPQNANMIELLNVKALGHIGSASIFLMRNINGEVKEFSIKFSSSDPVNRNIENNTYDLFVRECSRENIQSLKLGKSIPVGFLTHKRSERANRNEQIVSRYTLLAKKDPEHFIIFSPVFIGECNTNSQQEVFPSQSDENNDESSAV